jgi:hypothetical protein
VRATLCVLRFAGAEPALSRAPRARRAGPRAPPRQNFVVNAVATQYNDVLNPSDADGASLASVRRLAGTLDSIDTFFTVLFASELLVNLYAHWSPDPRPRTAKRTRRVVGVRARGWLLVSVGAGRPPPRSPPPILSSSHPITNG